MDRIQFERSKIYEKLSYKPEPPNYKGKIPWIIQQQISATNGIHFKYEVGNLNKYPIPDLPVSNSESSNALMLDIGSGWGRWLIAASKKNYIPIGTDLRLEFCSTSLEAMKDLGINGYAVVADLKNLPFKDNIFDLIWSFSVIQHTHKKRMLSCLNHIHRILKPGAFTKLEFPNKNGMRNRLGPVKTYAKLADDYNSWCVRYYTTKEYKSIFKNIFNTFKFNNHSFLGIGVLPNDLKYIKNIKNKISVSISLMLSYLARIIPGLKYFSDSIYITAYKNQPDSNLDNVSSSLQEFLSLHKSRPGNNLNIVPLLRCPKTGESLTLSNDETFLISSISCVKYPVNNRIPILIESEILF